MTQNAMQAKNSWSFPEQSVLVSNIPSSMTKVPKTKGLKYGMNIEKRAEAEIDNLFVVAPSP